LSDWSSLKRYGFGAKDALGLLHFADKTISRDPVGADAVKALSMMRESSENPQRFFTELILEIGRKPTASEGRKILRWSKILSELK